MPIILTSKAFEFIIKLVIRMISTYLNFMTLFYHKFFVRMTFYKFVEFESVIAVRLFVAGREGQGSREGGKLCH